MLHSHDLRVYEGSLSSDVDDAISEIKRYFGSDNLKVFSWRPGYIVVKASYSVSLPSRGSKDNLIRQEEPVLIRLSLTRYPEESPAVLSDRKDFPKSRLPHLYYTPETEPAVLCLVRDSLNQWFATITIADFLLVGLQWFFKAATGTLLEDNNEFDPVRLEKKPGGKHIYKYDMFEQIVKNDERLVPKFPMALILSCLYKPNEKRSYSYKSIAGIPLLGLSDIKKTVQQALRLIFSANDSAKVMSLFSLLAWNPDGSIESEYNTNLPTNFGELKFFLNLRDIDIVSMIASVQQADVIFSRIIPIIYAVLRPKKLIGYAGNYEFFTYTLMLPEGGLTALSDETEVYITSHTEPYSSALSKILSNENRQQKSLFVGVGSLGSKILMHDARVGKTNIGAIDDDNFEQHNLARHTLFSNAIGQNKATAIIEEVKEFYELDITSGLIAFEQNISDVQDDELKKYDTIVDTTASQQVMQHFALRSIPPDLEYNRCELVDDGQIGLLYKEGKQRNPRIDDLVYTACYMANRDNDLHIWRRNDAEREPTVLNIGLGCNSITTVMPDDLISFHAATFSQILSTDKEKLAGDSGLLYLNIFRRSAGIAQISNRYYAIDAFEILTCQAGSKWTLRLFPGIKQQLLNQCKKFGKRETGGVLIGVANYKTKVIHVFEIVPEPKGSSGTHVAFTRGITGLPEYVDDVKYNTGEIIGYIGEWHTHPMNLESLSGQDMKTIAQLQDINKKTPIPTCAVIITPSKVIPFVYE